MKKIITIALLLVLLFGCNTEKATKKNELILKGKVTNMETGALTIGFTMKEEKVNVELENGKFEFRTNLEEPAEISIYVPTNDEFGSSNYIHFYVDAGDVTVKLNGEDFTKDPIIEGSLIYDDSKKFEDEIDRICPEDPIDLYKEMSPLYSKTDKESIAKLEELQKKAEVVREKRWAAQLEAEEWFIDNNPDSYYAAVLIRNKNSGKRGGKTLSEVETEVARLSSEIQKTPIIQRLLKYNTEVAKTDIDLAEFMKGVGKVNYKKDAGFNGTEFKNIKYLASLSNGNVCALDINGAVSIISPQGKLVRNIEIAKKGQINAIAVCPEDKIYIPNVLLGKEKTKFRGKVMEVPVIIGVECYVFDESGNQQEKFELSGVKNIFGLKVTEDNILISDYDLRAIKVYDITTKEEVTAINDLRPCCLMLDFDVNNKNQIFVANLAAFRTSIFDFTGNLLATFGKRGKTINDFHGCCNPVNVASLPNGAIITVEKDPTRIKIYDTEGAKKINGIEELVEGCAYIPMTVDNNENIYLASPEKGLIRCISI